MTRRKFIHTGLILVSVIILVGVWLGINNPNSVHAADDHAPMHAVHGYGALPTSFIPNAGQNDPAVRFQARGDSGTLFFSSGGVTLSLGAAPSNVRTNGQPLPSGQIPPAAQVPIQLMFQGANQNVAVDGADQLPGIANFFVGNDPSKWRTNVPTYASVIYHKLYPGVDLTYTGQPGLLKGTYTLAAGVDPALIRWQYTGADHVTLASTDDLVIRTAEDVTLTERAPVAWQLRNDVLTPVSVGYQLGTDGTIGFAIAPGSYDPTLPLAIDPGLDYSTYLGAGGESSGYGIAVDGSGNAYVVGYTTVPYNPPPPGPFGSYPPGDIDAFVSELNASGTALLYTTFLSGNNYDFGLGIAVDSSGNAYVTGYTASANFPTTSGAFQTTFGGGYANAFVTKLNATGSALLYSTYLGGNSNDQGYGIAIDRSGNAYVTGYTNSANFPIMPGALQASIGGGRDGFITKLNATGSGLLYSTFLGGSKDDYGLGIALDGRGNAYVTGHTYSTDFPTTPGVVQPAYGGGYEDAFVSKLNPTGSTLAYSTFLGGNDNDSGFGIAVDIFGNAYVTGYTRSANFPTTSGAFQPTFGGGTYDAFVSKLNPIGSALAYSTFLGGSNNDYGYAITLDQNNENAYVTGATASNNFPTTSGAYQTSANGYEDIFITDLNSAGNILPYSTRLGGSGVDYGTGIATDNRDRVYITGFTRRLDFPITQTNGSPGSFAAKFTFPFLPTPTPPLPNTATPTSTLTASPTNTPIPLRIDSIGVFRTGTFFLRLHNSTGIADITVGFNHGTQPYPVVGDWTGNSFDTVGMLDQSNGLFTLCTANDTMLCAQIADQISFVLGNPNDIPLSGVWTAGFTHFGAGVFRPSNGLIYLKNNLTTGFADYTMVLGIPGDVGLAGDWNGDGLDSPGVYRPSLQKFYLNDQVCNCAEFATYTFQYGNPGDMPVIGDWIGQGHDGVGLFRQSNGYTYLRNNLSTGYADNAFTYGIAGDVPIAGHWQLVYPPAPNPGSVLVPPTAHPVATPPGGLQD